MKLQLDFQKKKNSFMGEVSLFTVKCLVWLILDKSFAFVLSIRSFSLKTTLVNLFRISFYELLKIINMIILDMLTKLGLVSFFKFDFFLMFSSHIPELAFVANLTFQKLLHLTDFWLDIQLFGSLIFCQTYKFICKLYVKGKVPKKEWKMVHFRWTSVLPLTPYQPRQNE